MSTVAKEFDAAELETLWADLAAGITAAGPEHETVYLTKLSLLLAREVGDISAVRTLIDRAGVDL